MQQRRLGQGSQRRWTSRKLTKLLAVAWRVACDQSSVPLQEANTSFTATHALHKWLKESHSDCPEKDPLPGRSHCSGGVPSPASSRARISSGWMSYPVARTPDQLRPTRMPSRSSPSIHRVRQTARGISSTSNALYAGMLLITFSALLRSDQNGMLRSPSPLRGAGKPPESRIPQTR